MKINITHTKSSSYTSNESEGTLDQFVSPHSCSPSRHSSNKQAAFGTSPPFSLTSFHFFF